MNESVRLQKILAHAGFGSRRECEKFIVDGRVTVDNIMVRQLGSKADPESQTVALDGQKVSGPGRTAKTVHDAAIKVYYMLNKPKGVLCTNDDPSGRPLAVQMIPEKRRIYCVGRLDLDTEGMILLTNDGELTNQLTHPRYGVNKTYLVKVSGNVSLAQIRKLEHGVHLAEGRTQGAQVRVRKRSDRGSTLELVISEGMNRQVRRMLAHVNLQCNSIKRIAIGPLRLGELPDGAFCKLRTQDIESLRRAIEQAATEANKTISHKAEKNYTEQAAPITSDDHKYESETNTEKFEEQETLVAAELTSDHESVVENDLSDEAPQVPNEIRTPHDAGPRTRPWEKRERKEGGGKPWENRERAPRDAGPRARPWKKRERKEGGDKS
ncbi:MAG: pseudouridine synthase [Planctomycetota bacterium]